MGQRVPNWTPEEDRRLIEAYIAGGVPEARRSLPERSPNAIATRLQKLRKAPPSERVARRPLPSIHAGSRKDYAENVDRLLETPLSEERTGIDGDVEEALRKRLIFSMQQISSEYRVGVVRIARAAQVIARRDFAPGGGRAVRRDDEGVLYHDGYPIERSSSVTRVGGCLSGVIRR